MTDIQVFENKYNVIEGRHVHFITWDSLVCLSVHRKRGEQRNKQGRCCPWVCWIKRVHLVTTRSVYPFIVWNWFVMSRYVLTLKHNLLCL